MDLKITKILIQSGHYWIFKYSLAFNAYSDIKWASKMIFFKQPKDFSVESDWYLLGEYMKREIKHNDPAGILLGFFLISLSSMFRKPFTSKLPLSDTLWEIPRAFPSAKNALPQVSTIWFKCVTQGTLKGSNF